jgi:hypothetical protein
MQATLQKSESPSTQAEHIEEDMHFTQNIISPEADNGESDLLVTTFHIVTEATMTDQIADENSSDYSDESGNPLVTAQPTPPTAPVPGEPIGGRALITARSGALATESPEATRAQAFDDEMTLATRCILLPGSQPFDADEWAARSGSQIWYESQSENYLRRSQRPAEEEDADDAEEEEEPVLTDSA